MRTSIENTFPATDGSALFYRYYPARGPRPRGAILLFHRGHEHSGRVAHLVEELDLPDFAFFAWDARGHGRSPGPRGDSPSVTTSVEDIQAFVDWVISHHAFTADEVAVIGQSVAGALLAAWAHDYAPPIRAMVLAAPAFRIRLYMPFARAGLRLLRAMRGNVFVNSYVKARLLTHDSERILSYDADPLITRAVSANVLLGLHDLSKRIVADAKAITVPTQLLIAGRDYVVDARPQHAFYEQLGTLTKECHILERFYHDVLGERGRARALDKIRSFLTERFEKPLERPSLLAADRTGFTRREADALARPLAPFSPAGLYWAFVRVGLRAASRFSEGIRLGIETGFDSGASLEYVHRNVAAGRTPFGRWIDRVYLDTVGWRGIRQRNEHVALFVREAMERLRRQGLSARVLDVAAGTGRYVLDAVDGAPAPDAIELRDYRAENVSAGRVLIRERGLERIATFIQSDAFDRGPATRIHVSRSASFQVSTSSIPTTLLSAIPSHALPQRLRRAAT